MDYIHRGKTRNNRLPMTMAVFMVRLFFVTTLAALSIIGGMWLGLRMVDGFKMVPKHKIINVQASPEAAGEAQTDKGGYRYGQSN